MATWWKVVYQDYPGAPFLSFSRHHTEQAAKRAVRKALRDPFWSDYIFSIQKHEHKRDVCPA